MLRCRIRGCQKYRSVRQGNRFFHFTDVNGRLNSKLTLCQILELAYLFVLNIPNLTAVAMSGRGRECVTDWFHLCREVCSEIVSVNRRGQMVGTVESPVQIDEAYFAGRRKYNRGRFLEGDNPAEEEDPNPVQNNRNHGRRIDGRWVFGLKKGMDVRLFVVEKRDRATLEPIIKREVAPESVIHSDEWPAYNQLNAAGFVHSTVNHQRNYVDPNTGVHTQNIERLWLDAKTKIMKTMRGTQRHLLQAHLDEYSWRVLHGDVNDLFMTFLIDLRSVFR